MMRSGPGGLPGPVTLRLLLVVYVHEFGVHHVAFVLLAAIAARGWWCGAAGRRARARSPRRLVHGLGQFVAGAGEAVDRGVDPGRVVIGHGLLGFLDGRFDFLGLGFADLGAMVLQRLLHVVDHGVGPVAGLDGFALLAVVGGVRLGVLGHLLHLFLGQAAGTGDGDLLLVVGAAILGGHVQYAVGVDIEGDFDLRNAARSRRNVAQLENSQQPVV